MAAVIPNSSEFPLFSSLPPELRNQIWLDSLSGKVEPALFVFQKGYWHVRTITEFDEEYCNTPGAANQSFEWRYGSLDDIQIELPLAFVNREARGIALDWIIKHGIKIRQGKD